MNDYTIGRLARESGVKVETIRYYERIGLIPRPPRTDGNYRLYGDDDLRHLTFIRRGRELGFTLDQLRRLIDLSENPDGPCRAVDVIVESQVADIEKKIADLVELKRTLTTRLAACERGQVRDCRVIDALSASSA